MGPSVYPFRLFTIRYQAKEHQEVCKEGLSRGSFEAFRSTYLSILNVFLLRKPGLALSFSFHH